MSAPYKLPLWGVCKPQRLLGKKNEIVDTGECYYEIGRQIVWNTEVKLLLIGNSTLPPPHKKTQKGAHANCLHIGNMRTRAATD